MSRFTDAIESAKDEIEMYQDIIDTLSEKTAKKAMEFKKEQEIILLALTSIEMLESGEISNDAVKAGLKEMSGGTSFRPVFKAMAAQLIKEAEEKVK